MKRETFIVIMVAVIFIVGFAAYKVIDNLLDPVAITKAVVEEVVELEPVQEASEEALGEAKEIGSKTKSLFNKALDVANEKLDEVSKDD